jgi:hypothetical protein
MDCFKSHGFLSEGFNEGFGVGIFNWVPDKDIPESTLRYEGRFFYEAFWGFYLACSVKRLADMERTKSEEKVV